MRKLSGRSMNNRIHRTNDRGVNRRKIKVNIKLETNKVFFFSAVEAICRHQFPEVKVISLDLKGSDELHVTID